MRRIAKPRVRPHPRGRPMVDRILFSSTPGPGSRVGGWLSMCLCGPRIVSKRHMFACWLMVVAGVSLDACICVFVSVTLICSLDRDVCQALILS